MLSKLWIGLLTAAILTHATASSYRDRQFTPHSRTLRPVGVYQKSDGVLNEESFLDPSTNHSLTLKKDAHVTYDFGKNVAGIVHFSVANAGANDTARVTFTESSMWASPEVSDSNADSGRDRPLLWSVSSGNKYQAEKKHQRGAFRYLTLSHLSGSDIVFDDLFVHYTAVPQYSDAQLDKGILQGHFSSDDEDLDRVWYAGAYTLELCSIDSTAGDSLIYFTSGTPDKPVVDWYQNQTISYNGSVVLVDGARRDRLVWLGDLAASLSSTLVSLGSWDVLSATVDSILSLQQPSGAFPLTGYPVGTQPNTPAFTSYHMWTLDAVTKLYYHKGDTTYLKKRWPTYKKGLQYAVGLINSTGLAYDPLGASWSLTPLVGESTIVNALLYGVLKDAVSLARDLGDNDSFIQSLPEKTTNLGKTIVEKLWDPEQNLFFASTSKKDMHPQDANSVAVLNGLAVGDRALNISRALQSRWGKYGAPAPELGGISPFATGFELQAHYAAHRPDAAVQLIKSMWADFLLKDPRMTQSTFIEGYSLNGSLHYAPYPSTSRVSHAHGWSTGPTAALSQWGAGIRFVKPGGREWILEPQLGGLKHIEAGYHSFSTKTVIKDDASVHVTFSSPKDTNGTVKLAYEGGPAFLGVKSSGKTVLSRDLSDDEVAQKTVTFKLKGGDYKITLKPN